MRPVAYWGAVAAVWLFFLAGGLVVYFNMTLSDKLVAGLKKRPPNITILADDGTKLDERGMRRGYVRLGKLPHHLVQAVISTEDRRFYRHYGVDPLGLVRATIINIRAGHIVQGGSTITQQLAKNVFLSHKRTYGRKLQEMLLALWLEFSFSKNQILELYLNRVYLGAGAYGVEAASHRYFGKSARALNLSEAAMLAGLLKAPSSLSPLRNLKRAQSRSTVVLANMVATGAISVQARHDAVKHLAILQKSTSRPTLRAGYAADHVYKSLQKLELDVDENLIVETTINAALQRRAQSIVRKTLKRKGRKLRVSQAAAVVLDLQGGIKAMIGGKSYEKSKFNRVSMAHRQPGSAFKPFVFLAALEQGLKPGSIAYDEPIKVGNWRPRNISGRYRGAVTLRKGLAHSVNSVAVRLLLDLGREKVVAAARRLGIMSPLHDKPSLALGTAEVTPLELTSAYVPFANGGYLAAPHIILRVSTAKGRIIYEREKPADIPILSRTTMAAMNDMMGTVVRKGTGRAAAIKGFAIAGKTGTTQGFRDAWFVGYSAYYAGGVWVGNDDGTRMKRVTGGRLPAKIWRQIMAVAHKGKAPRSLPGLPAPGVTAGISPTKNPG